MICKKTAWCSPTEVCRHFYSSSTILYIGNCKSFVAVRLDAADNLYLSEKSPVGTTLDGILSEKDDLSKTLSCTCCRQCNVFGREITAKSKK